MIKKNIRTLFTLGTAFINLTISDAHGFWPAPYERQVDVNDYLQTGPGIPLNSVDHFFCDKKPNATSADFSDELPYSSTSVTNLALPGGPDHVVHQFGKQLLIIPGNYFQSRMVCSTETKKQKFFRTVVMPDQERIHKSVSEGAGNVFSEILKLFRLNKSNDQEAFLKQEFWQEIIRMSDQMQAVADVGAEPVEGSSATGNPDRHDPAGKSSFPVEDGYNGGSRGGDTLFPLMVPVKPGSVFFEDFSGFWFPEKTEKQKTRKPQKINITVVPSADDSDSSSARIEVTGNPVIKNLTIIQFALLVGGFEVHDGLQEQLMNLDELSAVELEQLAEGFATTINNLDSLIENNVIQTPGLSNRQLIQLLLKIQTLIRELTGIKESQSDSDISEQLWSIRDNLRMLVSSRLVTTILGTHEVTVSENASQHELLVRGLLEADAGDNSVSDAIDLEELQDLMDEYIRRIRSGITGEELIRALIEKIEAIQRQTDRRTKRIASAHGSWLRALQNRLDSLRQELLVTEQELSAVISNYFSISPVFAGGVTGEVMPEPEDKGGKEGSKKTGNSQTPPTGGSSQQQRSASQPGSQALQSQPPQDEDEDDSDEPDDSDQNDGDTAGNTWRGSKEKRDMTVWFADLLRQFSLEHPDRLDVGSSQAGALLLKLEKQSEKARKIKEQIKILFQDSYPHHLHLLPVDDTEETLEPYILATLKIMRGVALANILFDVADKEELKDIREMYGMYVRGVRGQSVRDRTNISFPGSGGWDVRVTHNDQDWSYLWDTGQPVVREALEQLQLSQLLTTGSDGRIHISVEDQARFADAFLNHSDSGRTPVQFRFVRVGSYGGRTFSTREYDLHRFEDLSGHLASRFPVKTTGNGEFNPNSALAQASQRGGIEDSIRLTLNQNPEAAALLHWLFSPNNSTIPLSYMMFGQQGTPGVLQQHGLPELNPSSSNQADLGTQNCEVTVYSNGRMRVHYTVSYDRISRQTEGGEAVNYDAVFKLELKLDFDIRKPGGLEPLYQGFTYEGRISKQEQDRLNSDLVKEKMAGDKKIIDGMKNLTADLQRELNHFHTAQIDMENAESIREWRRYAALQLKFAFAVYYKLLANIRSRNLADNPNFVRAKKELDKALSEAGILDELVTQIQEFPAVERRTYDQLAQYYIKERMEQDDAFEQLEEHRQKVQDVLERLRQIGDEYKSSGTNKVRLSWLISYISELESLHARLGELDAEYNDRTSRLCQLIKELKRLNSETVAPDLFGPVNTLISAGRLHAMHLLTTLEARKTNLESAFLFVSGEKSATQEKKKKRRGKKDRSSSGNDINMTGLASASTKKGWKDLWGLLPVSPSRSTANSISTSRAGSEENILNIDGEVVATRRHTRTRSIDETSALRVRGECLRSGSEENILDAGREPLQTQRGFVDETRASQQERRRLRSHSVTDIGRHGISRPGQSSGHMVWRTTRYGPGNELLNTLYPVSAAEGSYILGSGVMTPPSPCSSSQQLDSLESTSSVPSGSTDREPETLHSRSSSDIVQGSAHTLQVPGGIPANHRQYSLGRELNIPETIHHSPVILPRHMIKSFAQSGESSGNRDISGGYRGRSSLTDSQSSGRYMALSPLPLNTPSSGLLEELVNLGVPGQFLAEAIVQHLPEHQLTMADFNDMLDIADSPCEAEEDWQIVQNSIKMYLFRGYTLENLAERLFHAFGDNYHGYVREAYERQSDYRRAQGETVDGISDL